MCRNEVAYLAHVALLNDCVRKRTFSCRALCPCSRAREQAPQPHCRMPSPEPSYEDRLDVLPLGLGLFIGAREE